MMVFGLPFWKVATRLAISSARVKWGHISTIDNGRGREASSSGAMSRPLRIERVCGLKLGGTGGGGGDER